MPRQGTYSVVWFKRDLRLHDHQPLRQALEHGPVLCLYVVEPSLWAEPDAARQHYGFLLESLRDLYRDLRQRGGHLQVVTGELTEFLGRLHHSAPFARLYSHQETGNGLSYRRDMAVKRWCQAHAVTWHEVPQFGVVRRLAERNHWQAHWEGFMAQAVAATPAPGRRMGSRSGSSQMAAANSANSAKGGTRRESQEDGCWEEGRVGMGESMKWW